MAQDVNFKKTSAAETQYTTGAQRDNRVGKGAFHWMPWDAVFLVSRIFELGNKGRSKTGDGNDRNWENGMPLIDLLQSALNHITAHISGDRSEPHISQAVWNLLVYLQTSIWVYLGFRDYSLNNLPNHRANWKPGDPPPYPLSPQEIEWLEFKGVIPKGFNPKALRDDEITMEQVLDTQPKGESATGRSLHYSDCHCAACSIPDGH